MLEDETDAAFAQGELVGVYVAEENFAGIKFFKAGNGAEQRGFAGTRRAEQGHQFAAINIERHTAQGRKAAEVFFDVFYADGYGHGFAPADLMLLGRSQ